MRKRIVTMVCIVMASVCMTACGGNQNADESSSETISSTRTVQSVEAHESATIEVPENAEGQLR